MPHGPHFYEPRTDIVLTGTITIPPDQFLDDSNEHFDHLDEISLDFTGAEHGFTYRIEITDVKQAETRSDGTIEVEYQKPGNDDHVTSTEIIPPGFTITSLTT